MNQALFNIYQISNKRGRKKDLDQGIGTAKVRASIFLHIFILSQHNNISFIFSAVHFSFSKQKDNRNLIQFGRGKLEDFKET